MAHSRICVIEGCSKTTFARNWCTKHYNRWRTTGDPLGVKKTARGEATLFFQEVVLTYDGDECLIWPFKRGWAGYGEIGVNRKMQSVPRLVCEAEHGPPPSPKHEAAHSCGKGHTGCCNRKHLRWATPAENAADRALHGTDGRGEKNGFAKLTEGAARQILELRGKKSQRSIAAEFGVSQCHVWRIHHSMAWDHLAS